MKNTTILILFIGLLIPQLSFAAWWNPFTWEIFKVKPIVIAPTTIITLKEPAIQESKFINKVIPKVKTEGKIEVKKVETMKVTTESEYKITSRTQIITTPNGAIIEVDEKGNLIKFVKESPRKEYVAPVQTQQSVSLPQPNYRALQDSAPKVIVSLGEEITKNRLIPGSKNHILARFKIETDKKVFINSIKWYQGGSSSFTARFDDGFLLFSNLKTQIGNNVYDVTLDEHYAVSDLGSVSLNPGENIISLTTDISERIRVETHHLEILVDIDRDIKVTDENGNIITLKVDMNSIRNYEHSGGFRNGVYQGYEMYF